MSPPTRQLGKNGPQVTAVGFGLMGLSAFYGALPSDEERFKVLDRAYELGETFWDSSDIYQDSEDLVGKWFARTGKRNDIFLATKFAILWEDGKRSVRGDPAYVKQACEKSLKRLGVDHIDLYYIHRVDITIPIEETVGALAELVKQGKVRYLGISECSSETLRRAHAVHPIHAVQVEYSPFSLDIESPEIGLLKTCRELGVAVVSYSPLGRGMLTGTLKGPEDFGEDDFRKNLPRFSKENFQRNAQLVDKISTIAQKKNATPGQLTLAWLLAQGEDIIPIPGTKKIKYLEENMGALDVTLTPEEEKEIRAACEAAEPAGERYPPGMTSLLYADSAPLKK